MEIIGIIAAMLTTGAFLPQAYKTIKTKQTKDLSLPTFLMIFTGNVCWTIYGFLLNDMPLIIANIITGFLSAIILLIKINAMRKGEE